MSPYFVAIMAVIGALSIGNASASDEDLALAISRERTVIKDLARVLHASGSSGRVYYKGICSPLGTDYQMTLPPLRTQPPSPTETGADAVRSLLRDNDNVVVSSDRPDIVRVRIGNVSEDLLQTQISKMEFHRFDQYSGDWAASRLSSSADVVAEMDRLRLRPWTYLSTTGLAAPPAEGMPHIAPEMHDVTLDEGLDTIATTFKGIVFFGLCESEGVFAFQYVPADRRWWED